MKNRDSIRIELTTEQKEQIEAALGTRPDAIELDAEELEQRIAPLSFNYGSVAVTYTQQG